MEQFSCNKKHNTLPINILIIFIIVFLFPFLIRRYNPFYTSVH